VFLTAVLLGIWVVALFMWRDSEFPNASQAYARWTWSDVAVVGVVLFGPFTMLAGALYRPSLMPWRLAVTVLFLLWAAFWMLLLSPYGQVMSCFDAEDPCLRAADAARHTLAQILLAVALGIGIEVVLRGIGYLRRRSRTQGPAGLGSPG
jgi:hypothetical protein